MPGPQDVVAKLGDTLAAAARCSTDETSQNYDDLALELHDLGELARLSCQSHDRYGALIGKLRAGDALSADELATVRRLIVGDADYYLKYDEEFERCKGELVKITGEIERIKASDFGVDSLMHLNVLCEEASNLLLLGQHYLEARDRVRAFEAATKGALDRDGARTLATIIEGMVA